MPLDTINAGRRWRSGRDKTATSAEPSRPQRRRKLAVLIICRLSGFSRAKYRCTNGSKVRLPSSQSTPRKPFIANEIIQNQGGFRLISRQALKTVPKQDGSLAGRVCGRGGVLLKIAADHRASDFDVMPSNPRAVRLPARRAWTDDELALIGTDSDIAGQSRKLPCSVPIPARTWRGCSIERKSPSRFVG